MNKVFTNGPEDWSSMPARYDDDDDDSRRVIQKTQEMVLDAVLNNLMLL